MPHRDQRQSLTASSGARLRPGLGATGLRLRLTRELSAGFVAQNHETVGKLLLLSPVNTQR